jgi:hypothetical protein
MKRPDKLGDAWNTRQAGCHLEHNRLSEQMARQWLELAEQAERR